MIGVVADSKQHDVVCELFELFKTPWEFAQSRKSYEVALFFDKSSSFIKADLTIVYSSKELAIDKAAGIKVEPNECPIKLANIESRDIPIYKNLSSINAEESKYQLLSKENSIAIKIGTPNKTIIRIGYNLLEEVEFLLESGQPLENARVPTLDYHLDYLRSSIVNQGVKLLEIPPSPENFKFIVCLSHDVDHPKLAFHSIDHTTIGFFYRAIFGSIFRVASGRITLKGLLRNWLAALSLPLYWARLTKDIWDSFKQYIEIEGKARSTFFVIPFKNISGKAPSGQKNKKRAAGYGASDIETDLREVLSSGREIGLHGLDAWRSSSSGKKELDQVSSFITRPEIGVRMHWLYFDETSHVKLEKAGFTYDSTIGYNACPGYRAGTTQAYKPLKAEQLLELPMHIMDTSLFYPSYLHLTEEEAEEQVLEIGQHANDHGGTVTVNWHDRSLAPERQWGSLYAKMIKEWSDDAWFPCMAEAASWFRKRRTIKFCQSKSGECRIDPATVTKDDLPQLILRIYNHDTSNHFGTYTDRNLLDWVQQADVA